MNKNMLLIVVLFFTCAIIVPLQTSGQSMVERYDQTRSVRDYNWLPYGFYTDSLGFVFGIGANKPSFPQEQSTVMGTLALGTKGTYLLAGGGSDIRIPGTERLFVDILFSSGYYVDDSFYIDSNPNFADERAGSNDSSKNNFIEETMWDSWAEMKFFYLLPIGDGADRIVNKYMIDRGMLKSGATGGSSWNPLKSGRTYIRLTPAWRNKTLDLDDNITGKTVNLKFGVEYNNFDFPANPQRGSKQEIYYTRDFTSSDLIGEWELYELKYSKVFDLGSYPGTKQQGLALSFWTAYVPTWETEFVDGKEVITKRPPYYEGATLGGFYRMRAYEGNRFNDKAAIYGSMEYRIIPEWQPLISNRLFEYFELDWMQFVFFAEAGRVASEWSVDELTSDLKYDVGASIRGMMMKSVFRLDFAIGEEGARAVAMYGQPF